MSDRLPAENTYLSSSEGLFSLPITVTLRVKINFKQISTELWKSASFSVTVWLQRPPFPILVRRGLTNQVHPLTLWQPWDNWALQRVWLRSNESDCTQLREGIECISDLISESSRCLTKYLGQISQSERSKELGRHTWKTSSMWHVACTCIHQLKGSHRDSTCAHIHLHKVTSRSGPSWCD